MMFDAAGLATAADVAAQQVDDPTRLTVDAQADDALIDALADAQAPAVAPPTRDRVEIVFVDAAIAGHESLQAAVRGELEVVVIGGDQDGLAQIADTLKHRSQVDAIHIVAHGAEGQKTLGTATLDAASLAAHAQALGTIGAALSADGDILLYGCRVAADTGALFVDELSRLTGADIAASTDLTGHADQGGDWVLEHETGTVEASSPFEGAALAAFDGVLAAPTITNPGTVIGFEDSGGVDLFGPGAVTAPESNFMQANVRILSPDGEGVLSDGTVSEVSLFSEGDRAAINAFLDNLKFVPTADWFGTVQVEVSITTDRTVPLAAREVTTFTLSVQVTPVSDAPQGSNATRVTAEDAAYTLQLSDFGFSDPDDSPADAFAAVRISSLPGLGTLSLDGVAVSAGSMVSAADIGAGKLVYTPGTHGFGTGYASFNFQVQDSGSTANGGVNLDPTPNTISFDVTPVNDAPTTANASRTVDKNGVLNFALSATDVDSGTNATTDAAVTQYQIVTLPANGVLRYGSTVISAAGTTITAAQAATLSFTPDANYTGSTSFSFKAIDAAGAESNVSTLSIAVNQVNEAPTITVGTPGVTLLEDAVGVAVPGLRGREPIASGIRSDRGS